MFIGQMIGSVVATRKTDTIEGLPLRLIQRVTPQLAPTDSYVVAVDVIGASEGELVLVAAGSPARQTRLTDNRPVDAVIMAIVDTWQIDEQVIYVKDST